MPAQGGTKSFAERLRNLLQQSGHTQADLARLADVDQSSISRYLRGECEPNLRQLRSIAEAFRVPVAILVGEDSREILAVEARANNREARYLLFCDGELVGEWHSPVLATILAVKRLPGTDAVARKLLAAAKKAPNGRKHNGSR